MGYEDIERRLQVLEGRLHELAVKYATLALELSELRHDAEVRQLNASHRSEQNKSLAEGARQAQRSAIEVGVAVGEVKAAAAAVRRSSSKLPKP